jgi:small conductance mechanosensitive channel
LDIFESFFASGSLSSRIALIVGAAVGVHLLVILTRKGVRYLLAEERLAHAKLRSVVTLASSTLVFALYFLAVGFVLRELGVSLTAYLASASVIGLAVGFGSQGIVQDVVMGLTFIFSDVLDVGDLVEVGGQTGIVKGISMRFVELENALGARVFVPNRTINNVINYPKGYIRCLVDVTLTGSDDTRTRMLELTQTLMRGFYDQFPGILLTQPSIEGRFSTASGKEYLRVKFRIWPNRGQPIETTFVKELIADLKAMESTYQDWMIAVFYEVEEKHQPLRPNMQRRRSATQ